VSIPRATSGERCSALTAEGLTALMTIRGATTKEVFRAYTKNVLAPELRQGDWSCPGLVDTPERLENNVAMPRKTYPLEYRQRLVELVRAGQSPEALAREYEPSAKTIREWVEQASSIDRGKGGLTEADKDRRIRELEKQLEIEREEKEILKKPRPGSRGRAHRSPSGVRVHESAPGPAQHLHHGACSGALQERLQRLASARAVGPSEG
jgi:transposase